MVDDPINVLVVDDQSIIREELCRVIAPAAGITVAAIAKNAFEALHVIQ